MVFLNRCAVHPSGIATVGDAKRARQNNSTRKHPGAMARRFGRRARRGQRLHPLLRSLSSAWPCPLIAYCLFVAGWPVLVTPAMSSTIPLQIDIVSDVVCPWCYIGKRRIENALALAADVPVEVHWRPFFLNPWVPREGIDRDTYLETKFGSVEAYKGIAGRVVAAAGEEGLLYRPDLVKRQPNTIDCHRLNPLGGRNGPIRCHEAAADGAVFQGRRRSHRHRGAGAGGGRLRARRRRRAQASAGDEDVELTRRCAFSTPPTRAGISGVPTFVFANKYAVSGAQPAEQLARAIRQVSAEVNAMAPAD